VRTLVVGAAGMLGQDLTCDVGFSRSQLDVTDRRAVREAISKKDLVFNCAAWTDVDGAEEHEDEALRVNRDGARNVAEAAGVVVYVSSDYVFDGRKGEPYVESDPVNPLSAYGRSKLEGEWATAEANPRHLIVRSSWLYGHGGRNFVETMLGLGPDVRVVDDQVGSPTYTPHLAAGLSSLATTEEYGIHHLAASGACSWFEFAREIFERAGKDVRVDPCTAAEFGRPAPRPANSVLASERGHRLPSWQEGLDAYLGVRV
jgi:dTDP-4-dehydrorhamnose reductase